MKDMSTIVSIAAVVGGIVLVVLAVLAGIPLLASPFALIAYFFGSVMLIFIFECSIYSVYLKIKLGRWTG